MTTLSSKIDGMQLWTYDIARRPDKTPDTNGNPQLNSYTFSNTQQDGIKPTTQNPTESLTQALNQFRYICDINHMSTGKPIQTHGIKFTTSDNLDQQIQTTNTYSDQKYNNAMFYGDDIYIQAPTGTTVTQDTSKTPFTTSTPGIKIIHQTGIVKYARGFAIVIFELETGYKIPVNNTITATPKIQSLMTGNMTTGTTETFKVATEITPGIYEITLTEDQNNTWYYCDVNFATVQDTTTPTTPTTPTNPVTIPILQDLEHATSNITGASIDRKLNAISLTADSGYSFQTSIQILFYSGGKIVGDYNTTGNNKDSITIPLNTTTENTITDKMDDVLITATATLITLPTGYEHNYLITDTELNAFGADQIWTLSHDDEGVEAYNVSLFINNIIELPFIVNATTTISKISVGREKSHVVSHEAKERIVTLDLGHVQVPAKYHNGYDYQNKSIKLYAPFVPPITVDNENAINKTIHIIYKVDISNGNLTVNLYNDDVLFFTGTNNISSQLPFLNTLKNTIINRDTHFTDNDIRQPYIIVSRETPILNSDYYPTNERGLIKNYDGNIQVRLLNNMNIPNNELSELTNQLESGVRYVKSN